MFSKDVRAVLVMLSFNIDYKPTKYEINKCFDELLELEKLAVLGKAITKLIENGDPDMFYALQFEKDAINKLLNWYNNS